MSTQQKEKAATAVAETAKPQAQAVRGLPKSEREHVAAAMIREQEFREDLFYRFNVFPIEIPPCVNAAKTFPCS